MKQRKAVTRVESLIQDWSLPDGYEKVIVLGKHLCGPGTDAGIEFVRQHLPRVLGCVFATCCCCKLVGGAGALGAGTTLFSDLYFGSPDGPSGAARAAERCAPCDAPLAPTDENASAVAETTEPAKDAGEAKGELGTKEAARARDAARLAAAKEKARAAGKQLCRTFLRFGECSDGGACRFHHCMETDAEEGEEEHALFRRYRFPAMVAAGEGQGGGPQSTEAVYSSRFLRRVLPDVARATSWRNAVFNGKHHQTSAYSEVLEQARPLPLHSVAC